MKHIKDFSLKELEEYVAGSGQPKYRAKEIFSGIYKEKRKNFSEITTLPKEYRKELAEQFNISTFEKLSEIKSTDETTKYVFKLKDNSLIESVLIREENKYRRKMSTLCISTQVGCPLGCKFCATGRMGFKRNLATSEIIEQSLVVEEETPLSNIVYMGMGEPLLNYENTKKSVEILSDIHGRNFGRRRITISTAGIVDKIYRLSDEIKSVTLAISLHTASQAKRNELMPGLSRFPIRELLKALKYYVRTTGNTITIEYLLINNFNDSKEDADNLIEFAKEIKFVKINLISLNELPFMNYRKSTRESEFEKYLLNKNLRATLRKSKGTDISAACGQLATNIPSTQKST